MPISDEKYPWESYTEMVAFVGLLASLVASFNLWPGVALTSEQTAGIGAMLFLLVMIVRKMGNGGIVKFRKTE